MAGGTALVLSGGNALGAYHGGAWAALQQAGIEPDWIAGSSIGAVTAALIAGNPPDRRADALRRFWDQAAAPGVAEAWLPAALLQPLQYGQAVASRLFGRAALFLQRPPDLTGQDSRPGRYDMAPMRRLLAELIDLDRLNDGETRVSVLAVDLATGQPVVFDTASGRLELEHLMASTALIPDFPPVQIAGRQLVDGGFWANLPVDVVLSAPHPDGVTCITVDLLPAAAALPRGLLQASQRQTDLIYACQSERALQAAAAAWHGRQPGASLLRVVYTALAEETALKGFDFSQASLTRRWQAGEADMQAALARWRETPPPDSGLAVLRG